jgi:nitrogen regulatory protein P-II 1
MRKIQAIIQPSTLEAVKKTLTHAWISGITVSEVKGYGRQRGHTEIYRGSEYVVETTSKYAVEVVVPDPLVPRIVDELEHVLRTGRIGDGKIFVTPVEDVVRVRTGERGESAL